MSGGPIPVAQVTLEPCALTLLAEARGAFVGLGLEVITAVARSADQLLRDLLDGRWELGVIAMDCMAAWNAGREADFVALARMERTSGLKLLARPSIRSVAELAGRTLAVDDLDIGFGPLLEHLLAGGGLPRGMYELQGFGAPPVRLDALRDGRAVATLLGPPFDELAEQDGFRSLGDIDEWMPDYPSCVLVANRRWLQDHRGQAIRYLRALVNTVEWASVSSNQASAAEALQTAGVPPPLTTTAYRMLPDRLDITPEQRRFVVEILAEAGAMGSGTVSTDSWVDYAHLEYAIQGG